MAGGSEPTGVEPDTRVTITEVARLAGVSPTTVSHVLSGKRIVAADTSRIVHDAIRRLGYRPNSVARSLRTRRSLMVAVVVPDITNTFYSVLTRGLADAVDEAGYGTYVANTDGSLARETKFLQDILDRGADGIVMASVDMASVGALGPANLGTPVVCVDGTLDHPRVDVVTADDEIGSHAATAHLLARRPHDVAMIRGPLEGGGPNRVLGFTRAMQEAGRPVDPALVVASDWTRHGGYQSMRALLDRPARLRPDAVFCGNDLMAIGAVDAVHECGLTVPGDVAIAGFDDIDAATIVNPPLTTVRYPAYETGAEAGRLLLTRLTGDYAGRGRTTLLKCPLVIRRSA